MAFSLYKNLVYKTDGTFGGAAGVNAGASIQASLGNLADQVAPLNYAPAPTGVAATDTANLQAAINATPSGGRLYLQSSATFYTINAPLTVPRSMTIEGDSIAPLFTSLTSGGLAIAPTTPYLAGAVIQQTVAATDIFSLTVSGITVNLGSIGLIFANGLASTGHGVNSSPSQVNGSGHDLGLQDFKFDQVYVYGHDGNHYAFTFLNPQLGTLSHCHSYGGGGFRVICDLGPINTGNLVFIHPYAAIINSGTAAGFCNSSATTNASTGMLNLMTYIRPQAIASGSVSTAGTNPLWTDTAGAGIPQYISVFGADLETSGTCPFTPGGGTFFDGYSLINGAPATNVRMGAGAMPNWTQGGINSAYGYQALLAVTTGVRNNAVGANSLAAITTTNDNVGVGDSALRLAIGSQNTAIGSGAMAALATSAGANVAVGFSALGSWTGANGSGSNTAVGGSALASQTTGANNTAVGFQAGQVSGNVTTSAGNQTFVGYKASQASSTQVNNITCIGANTSAGAAGVVAIGLDHAGTAATSSTQDVIALGTALHQLQLKNNTTGAGSAALGANCPATTATAPYTWIKMMSSDGSTVYIPAWK